MGIMYDMDERRTSSEGTEHFSQRLGAFLLQGWTMLDQTCTGEGCPGQGAVPLMRSRDTPPKFHCVACKEMFLESPNGALEPIRATPVVQPQTSQNIDIVTDSSNSIGSRSDVLNLAEQVICREIRILSNRLNLLQDRRSNSISSVGEEHLELDSQTCLRSLQVCLDALSNIEASR